MQNYINITYCKGGVGKNWNFEYSFFKTRWVLIFFFFSNINYKNNL